MPETVLKFSPSWMSEDQRDIFADRHRFKVIRAGRRWGKTTGAATDADLKCIVERGRKELWVDVNQKNIDAYVEQCFLPILPKEIYHWEKQHKVLTFRLGGESHNSKIVFGSVERPEGLEGFGYKRIRLNEAGIILKGAKGESLWRRTLRPMIMEPQADGTQAGADFIGTPKGLGLFKELSGRCVKEPEIWKEYHRTTYDRPDIDEREIAEIVKDLTPNEYRQEILAEFLDSEDRDLVIPYDIAHAAYERDLERDRSYRPIWGVDVAVSGNDESALAKRQWHRLIEPTKTWREKEGPQLAGIIQEEFEATEETERPSVILVDMIGWGYSAFTHMLELGLPVRGVNVANKANNADRYFQKRDELWFKARKWLEVGSIWGDVELMREFTFPVFEEMQRDGRIKVESKKDMRSRNIKSPNRADAFCLTMDAGIEKVEESRLGPWFKKKPIKSSGTWMSL